MTDTYFMNLALKQANIAFKKDEVPVGAIIVKDNKVISKGYNLRESKLNSLKHAELIAIDRACKKLNSWRLIDCTLYVTLEPCSMCMGAIINSRIKRVVFAATDPKAGALGSILNLNEYNLNHKVEVTSGILEDESRKLLQDFFKSLRKKKKG